MKPLAPNTLLQNRYLIVHLIGKGGMGEVYLAVDQRLGSAIALKRTYYAGDEQLGNAFEREARTLARLRHAVLPKVSDHFIENGNQFLVMEHISGDDLSKRLITTQKAFPLSWVLFWADQLLDALAYLHSHEPPIIHRDIKPQNLKLTDENNIVLLDFGLSKNSVTPSTGTSGSTTGSSSVVGYTPHYAPMEQIRGTGTSPRSDIYSLSATLYQLLTNVVPPDALTRADQIIGGKPDPIQPITEINSEIPRPISDVILKGMSISQEQRYAGAREMQKILREAYASMQNAMAAQTVAFNAGDAAAPAGQTEPLSSATPGGGAAPQFDMGAQTIPYNMMENGAGAVAEPAANQTEQFENFDATIRDYQMPADADAPAGATTPLPSGGTNSPTEFLAPPDSTPKQSSIKTEVFVQSDFAPSEYSREEPAAATPVAGFDAAGRGGTAADQTPNFTGDQTTPYIAYDQQAEAPFLDKTQVVGEFDAGPPAADHFAPAETQFQPDFASPAGAEQQHQHFNAPVAPPTGPPVRPTTPEKKKSKGMLVAVLGGLFGLLILAAGALGVGWYLMRDGGTAGNVNAATPAPTATVTATPTPEPTPEPTPDDANTNANTNANANANVVNTATPTPERTPLNVPATPGRTVAPPPQTPPRTPPQQRTTPQQQQQRTPVKTPRPTPPM